MKIAFTLLLALLLAQQPDPVSEATGVIRGSVFNGVTGTPLAGATIKLISADSDDIPPATTDREGKFELKSLTARRGGILASLEGYNYPSKSNGTSRTRQITLA